MDSSVLTGQSPRATAPVPVQARMGETGLRSGVAIDSLDLGAVGEVATMQSALTSAKRTRGQAGPVVHS